MRTIFEHHKEPLLTHRRFARRMLAGIAVWLALAAGGLLIGMAGYALTEGWGLVDSFLNAAMILAGMGPVGAIKTTAGKIFAGVYALFSGLFVVVATGFVLAPVFHRVLHAFHIEDGRDAEG